MNFREIVKCKIESIKILIMSRLNNKPRTESITCNGVMYVMNKLSHRTQKNTSL